jgi:hypothetical protein
MEPSMHNMKIPPDSHIPENPPVPRGHHPLSSRAATPGQRAEGLRGVHRGSGPGSFAGGGRGQRACEGVCEAGEVQGADESAYDDIDGGGEDGGGEGRYAGSVCVEGAGDAG